MLKVRDASTVIPWGGALPTRIDTVEILLTGRTFPLPWDSRNLLLAGIPAGSLREAFERVGTSRPVTLARKEKVDLLEFIEVWGKQVGCWDMLPQGIYELRNALNEELGTA